jgi:hypothetical protein
LTFFIARGAPAHSEQDAELLSEHVGAAATAVIELEQGIGQRADPHRSGGVKPMLCPESEAQRRSTLACVVSDGGLLFVEVEQTDARARNAVALPGSADGIEPRIVDNVKSKPK